MPTRTTKNSVMTESVKPSYSPRLKNTHTDNTSQIVKPTMDRHTVQFAIGRLIKAGRKQMCGHGVLFDVAPTVICLVQTSFTAIECKQVSPRRVPSVTYFIRNVGYWSKADMTIWGIGTADQLVKELARFGCV